MAISDEDVQTTAYSAVPSLAHGQGGVPGMTLNPATRSAHFNGRTVTLARREFDLLAMLVSAPGRAFTRTELLREVWGVTEFIDPSTVTVHVRRLRAKLEADPPAPCRIRTIWGLGYRLEL